MQSFLTSFKTGEGILSGINLILENIPKKGQVNNSLKEKTQENSSRETPLFQWRNTLSPWMVSSPFIRLISTI